MLTREAAHLHMQPRKEKGPSQLPKAATWESTEEKTRGEDFHGKAD